MAFPPDVAEGLLVACHRRCCICHKYAGMKMEIHHIVPKPQGDDTEGNGIPLCLDCHAEVGAYNPQHPKGRKFNPSELRRHKEQWFNICAMSPWQSTLRAPLSLSRQIVSIDDSMFNTLRCDDRRPAQRLVNAIMQQDKPSREEFVRRVFEGLQSEDEDTRWKFAMVVEELVLWEPRLVPPEVLVSMSRDKSFSVRSSAAVCYYYLAVIEPVSVPLDMLSKLAAYDEDWYVTTPATSALLRLARARPVVIDILAQGLDHKDKDAQEHAASAIKRLAQIDWDLLPDDLINHMVESRNSFVKEVGEECCRKKKDARKEPQKDYSLF